jgi:hypothetical protein
MPSTRASRLTAILTAVAVVVLCVAACFLQMIEPRIRQLSGTIVAINPNAAEATLELRNPKTGKLVRRTGEVAKTCEFFVGEEPADASNFNAGDAVDVTIEIHPYPFRIIVMKVRKAAEAPSTEAATQPVIGVEPSADRHLVDRQTPRYSPNGED